MARPFRYLIGDEDEEMFSVKDPQGGDFDPKNDLFSHKGMGNHVAVAGKSYGAVFANLPVDPVGGVKGIGRKGR